MTSRRHFLKSSGAAGVALAGSLVARASMADTESATTPEFCGFSELPSDPTTSYESDPSFGKRQEMNRGKVGRFLGVGVNNICLTDNTTMGLSMTLMGLNFRPGDRVILTNHEHNAIKSPLTVLKARIGLQLEERFFPPADVLNSMNSADLLDVLLPNTDALKGAKALCVSHVYLTTGVRLPLRALREKADELDVRYLIVDGAQAMGMIDLTRAADNIEHSDFYACPGHKWLNGPPSTGLLYLRDENICPPEFYPVLSQRMSKYLNNNEPGDAYYPMAKALQVRGCSNTPGFSAMLRAMEIADDSGGAIAVENRILALSQRVKNFLLSRSPQCIVSPHSDPALLSGLTAFFPFRWDKPGELLVDRSTSNWIVAELLKKRIQVRSIGFDNSGASDVGADTVYAIRVSTACFNTENQIEIFTAAPREVLMRV